MKQSVYSVVMWIGILFRPMMQLLAVLSACLVLAAAAMWAASGFPLDIGAPVPAEQTAADPELTGIAAMLADRVNRPPLARAPEECECVCITATDGPAVGGLKSAPNEFDLERVGEDERPNKADRKE